MQSLKYFTFFKLPKRIYKNENETNDETTLLLCHEITCKTTQKIRRNRIDRKKKSKCDQNHFKSCVVLTMCFFIGFARNCTHCTNKYKKKRHLVQKLFLKIFMISSLLQICLFSKCLSSILNITHKLSISKLFTREK